MVFPKNNLFMQKIALGTESRFPTLRVSRNFLLFKGGIESTHERASERLVCLSHKVKLTTDGHSRHLECEGKVRPTPPFPTPKVVQGLCLSLSRFRSIQLGRSFVLCQCSELISSPLVYLCVVLVCLSSLSVYILSHRIDSY